VVSGRRDFGALTASAEKDLAEHGWKVDYVSVRNRETLQPAAANDSSLVVLAAAWLGKTRLIDNIEFD
jgi:pantoate--beta-alanine ligase